MMVYVLDDAEDMINEDYYDDVTTRKWQQSWDFNGETL
jgi:hypothetical protein